MSCYEKWLHSSALQGSEKAELKNYSTNEQKKFETTLSFGTAGIRGPIGLGPHRLNRFTIRQVTEAYYRYLSKKHPRLNKHGLVIAYDNRHCSRSFAEEAASLFAYHHIPVHLYRDIRPTPMLSFAIRKLHASGGIMITASHNPPSDNGFKVYGPDGSQLLPLDAKYIEQQMKKIDDVLTIPTLSYVHAKHTGKIMEISDEIDAEYYAHVQSLMPCTNTHPTLTVVYTALHGTGQVALPSLFQKEKFIQAHVVPEQCQPHPDFPTVASPNPEDKLAFTLAKNLAHKVRADMIIATDPDADRVGIMIPHQNDYIHLTGNQIGVLLLHYLATEQKKKGTVYSTIVSTSLTQKIAAHHGIKTIETLTGFKYISELIEKNQDLLLGFEESHGYLVGDFVRDKDGVQTSLFLCHLAAHYKKQGKSLQHVLEDIYSHFGYHQTKIISLSMDTAINVIDDFFTLWKDKAKHKLDYRLGADDLPKAEVGKVLLHDGSWIAIRPSGTEPKVKIYMEAVGKNKPDTDDKMIEFTKITSNL
jgi:phosphoglucomutase